MASATISSARYIDLVSTTHSFLGGTNSSYIVTAIDFNVEVLVTSAAGAHLFLTFTSNGVVKWSWSVFIGGAAGAYAIGAGRNIVFPGGLVMARGVAMDVRSAFTNLTQANYEFNVYGKVVS